MSNNKPPFLYVNLKKSSTHLNPISFETEKVYKASDLQYDDLDAYVSADDLFKVLNTSRIDDDFESPEAMLEWIKNRR